MSPTPFTVEIPRERIERTLNRVRNYEWFEEPNDTDEDRWQYGCSQTYLRELCAYWVEEFDWHEAETRLNRFPQYTSEVDGINIHFIHEKGSNPDNAPLILLHGWPGSYFEFMEVIEPLAHPERFGGKAEDGCDVIVPSLIGYGFSGKPPRPLDPRGQAAFMNKLMTDELGFERYIAQGGDWGSSIASWIGFNFGSDKGGACEAVHLNMFGLRAGGDFRNVFGVGIARLETTEEKAWSREAAERTEGHMAYMLLQATKPQSLAYGMMDSPVGIAAWITEKFHTWSDRSGKGEPGGSIENAFSKDQILTNIMIYIAGRCFHSAAWQYWAVRESGNSALPRGERIMVPVGLADFPRELSAMPPRTYAEKAFANIVQITHPPRGGHFAALEQPALFVEDVRGFLSRLDS